MKKTINRTLSLILALALLFSVAAILPAAAKGGEEQEEQGASVSKQLYAVVADCGVITPKYGKLEDGKAQEGAVMTIALDEDAAAGHTFDYWKSIYGDVVPEKSFEVYVDRDVYFYPVFSDISAGFGEWTLLAVGDCYAGDVYVRTHSEYVLKQFKLKRYNNGEHDYHYEFVDDDTCRAVCSHCGDYYDEEHWLDEGTVIKQPTADEDGIIEYTCQNCGGKVTQAISAADLPQHEHSWTDYGAEILVEAKDGQPGIRRVHCTECGAAKDVWYIKAEWEKYYFGNHVFFDTSDSTGLWGTADEHHYSFVNAEGYNTYVYSVREDYRDNDTCWELMWIDHADELGRKPLYVAKSKGQTEYSIYKAYSWAVIDYDIQTVDQYISYIDHIRTGDDRYSSSFFDNVKRYETLYNSQYFPADGSSDFLANMNGTWIYETDDSLRVDDGTGIAYYDIMFNDRREFLHIDPLTNCVILRYEPTASYRWSQIKKIQPIVTPDEYAAITAAFPAVEVTPAPDPYAGDAIDGHTESDHNYGNTYQQTVVNELYHKLTCSVCGKEIYSPHEMVLKTPHLNLDDLSASTATYYCPYCGYEEERPYLMSAEDIQTNLYLAYIDKSGRRISLNNDVLHTPQPVNFQLRVDPNYLVGGPEDNTYTTGDGGYNRYYSKGYAASNAYSYNGSQGDYLAFGVIRAAENDHSGVELRLSEVLHYEFKRWEIYDWATGTWQLFSTEPTPLFNYNDSDGNTLVHDLTILRAVREYVAPVTHYVKVEGGSFFVYYGDEAVQLTEGYVDDGSTIYIDYDETAIPSDKNFDHWDVYKDGELIDTTPWSYVIDCDGLVIKPGYIDKTYYVPFSGEYGYVYLISDGSESEILVSKDPKKPGEDEPVEYWGGEYTPGTVITVTTAASDAENFPYFLGWYRVVYSEMGTERELLTTDYELTVTVTPTEDKDEYVVYVAIWSETETFAEDADYRTLYVTDGFASVRRMRDGLYLSCARVPYYSSITLMADPGAFLDAEKWTLTGVCYDGSDFCEELEDDPYEYWFPGGELEVDTVNAAPVGVCTLIFADGDGDGMITINDATRVQRVLCGLTDDLYGQTDLTCDLSGNGTVDIVDATLIQRYLAGDEVPNAERIGELLDTLG